MTDQDYPQVGAGWAFPPMWDAPRAGDGTPEPPAVVLWNHGKDHIRDALLIHLRTMRGSRVMRPRVGAGVDRYVFEPRTSAVCYRLADDVRRALMIGEPRVIVDSVAAEPAGDADDRIDVTIEYRIDRHRRPESLVMPFYVAGAA